MDCCYRPRSRRVCGQLSLAWSDEMTWPPELLPNGDPVVVMAAPLCVQIPWMGTPFW